jgi:cytochrome c-type biogenesis protein CcmE
VKKVIIPIVVVVILAAVFAALVYTSDITPVGAITDNPEQYRDRQVTVVGNVTERIAYQDTIIIRVEDSSGMIAVQASGEVPALGSEVVVKGVVKSMIKIGPYEFGSMISAEEIRSPYPWEKLASKK